MHKGQRFLLVVFGLVLLVEMVLFIFQLFSQKPVAALFASMVRSALEATLMSLIYRGHNWARLVMAALFGLGCAFLIWAIVRTGSAVLAAAELLYLAVLYALLWSPSVREFLDSRRALRLNGGMRKPDEEAPKYEPG